MRRPLAPAVVSLATVLSGLALAVPAPAQALPVSLHHKPGHEHGPPGSEVPAAFDAPVLRASSTRVSPGATVRLTASADADIVGGTWQVKDGDGTWRALATLSSAEAHGHSVSRDVVARSDLGLRRFKVTLQFEDGAATSNRVRVRSVEEPDPGAPPQPPTPEVVGGGFKAVTWNVYYGTPVTRLRPILQRLIADGVSVFLMQEMSNPAARRMVEEEGLELHYVGYQWLVAWDPDVWTAAQTGALRLSSSSFRRLDGTGPVFADSALATLRDAAGRTLDVMSYHLPPNVQQPNPERERLRIDRDAAATWRRLVDTSTADAVLFGGDDNVDESSGYRSDTDFWDFLRRPATGLSLVQAPDGTIGRYRRIDDFRVRGLQPAGGYTADGGGDHKLFVSSFRWR
jgi:hypothetical protein